MIDILQRRYVVIAMVLGGVCLLDPEAAWAYIGPGAGFAFLGSSFVFVLTIVMAIATLALWPLQFAWRRLRGKGISRHARTRRVVVVGLDGLEPKLVEKYIDEGKLPHMKQLQEDGSYHRLGTTLPALSPVAWSTFQTGVNPGAHNIFDFLTRDKRTCLPELSSTEMQSGKPRFGFGPFRFGKKGQTVGLTRKSQPFWKILGKHGVASNIIRVPISYPPEKFEGNILSAMCTPDLKGSQGSFTFFTTRAEEVARRTGGEFRVLNRTDSAILFGVEGPPHPTDPKQKSLEAECIIRVDPSRKNAVLLETGDERETLILGEFSRWIELKFFYSRSKYISGIARFCLREMGEEISLYVSPVNANPESPALPIAEPIFFSSWLAKRNGFFGTLGLMEDTWGRNEHALDDKRFLEQAYLNHGEREKMFFDVLERTPEGVCACVFDASDRIQHMFWRYLEEGHPSPRESSEFERAIPDMYERMDVLVGEVRKRIRPTDVLVVLSDHGFASFRRGINLNTWLYENGYLVVKNSGVTGADYLQDVDWTKTRAFAVGLTGIYLNRAGRERSGIVTDAEAEDLKREIIQKLQQLRDPKDGAETIRQVYDSAISYHGLYAEEAPDFIVGYAPGYRVSWDSVTGTVEPEIFSDNTKAWSGDHHIDPKEIPGILFTNRRIEKDSVHIADIAPTVLNLFAVPVPKYMEGKVLC